MPVEIVKQFVVRAEYGDDRYITHRRTFDWEPFLFVFRRKVNVVNTYRDTSGADFAHLGGDTYQHIRLGTEYTRDRQRER